MIHSRNGGPAFPAEVNNNTDDEAEGFLDEVVLPGARHEYSGMTLRDYFAAKAMQGFAASPSMIDSNDSRAITYVAAASYAIADAMLAERAES